MFTALLVVGGPERARFMLDELARMARAQRIGWKPGARQSSWPAKMNVV